MELCAKKIHTLVYISEILATYDEDTDTYPAANALKTAKTTVLMNDDKMRLFMTLKL